MKAVLIAQDQSLSWGEFETPAAGDNQILVKVHATAINRADLMQRRGLYPPPPGASPVMGLECAGEVAATGSGATRYKPGDAVCALLPGGGYAEYAVVDEGSALPVPANLSMAEAAALPEVFATAWLNLFMEAGLAPGEKVVIHAGASGVGTAAIQLCRAFDSPSHVTAGSEEKVSACIQLGAASGSDRHEGSFLEKARAFGGEGGVDVILDPVGGAYLADNLQLLGLNGRLALIGLMGGAKAEIDLALVLRKRLKIIGSTLRARSLQEKAAVMSALEARVWPKIEAGEISPIIEKAFPMEEVSDAHDLVASNQTTGKVVLSIAPA